MDARSSTFWEKLFSLTSPRPYGADAKDGLSPPLRADRLQITAAIEASIMRCGTSKQGLKHASFPIAGWRVFKIPVYATGGYLKRAHQSQLAQVN